MSDNSSQRAVRFVKFASGNLKKRKRDRLAAPTLKAGLNGFDRLLGQLIAPIYCCPWMADGYGPRQLPQVPAWRPPLYSEAERRRRDASIWTPVQAVLAPAQFAMFLISLGFVMHCLLTGHGLQPATMTVLLKTAFLAAIMVTGMLWERDVFGRYLLAPAFFWEDVTSFLVVALHAGYVVVLAGGLAGGRAQMLLALAAYAAYLFNAGQFVLKLRAARRERPRAHAPLGLRDYGGAKAG